MCRKIQCDEKFYKVLSFFLYASKQDLNVAKILEKPNRASGGERCWDTELFALVR